MGIQYNPRIVTDGLVLALDAANPKSYPGSGTIWSDLSGRGNTGTLTNGPTYNGANYGSIVFDGINQYITCGNIPTIGTGDFAINCWVYLPNVTPTSCWRAIVTIGNGYATAGGITLYAPRSTSPVNTAVAILNGVNPTISGTSNVNNSVWHHIVLTRLSNNLSIYVDSVLDVSTSNTANITQTAITIGRDINCGNTYYQGNIAQVSIYNRALSAAEVSQNYNALKGRYVSLDPYILLVSLLLRNSLTDESPLHKTITANGTVSISTTTVKYGTGSIAVNGNSGYLTTSSDASLGMGTGDFTVELWIYMTSAWSDSIGIFGFSSGHGVSSFGGTLSFWKGGGFYFYSSGTLPQNQWAHIALTRQGTTLKLFVDGTSIATVTFSEDLGSTASIDIGRHNGKEVNGFIDDFRVTKGISRYNSNFTPPSVELPNY